VQLNGWLIMANLHLLQWKSYNAFDKLNHR